MARTTNVSWLVREEITDQHVHRLLDAERRFRLSDGRPNLNALSSSATHGAPILGIKF